MRTRKPYLKKIPTPPIEPNEIQKPNSVNILPLPQKPVIENKPSINDKKYIAWNFRKNIFDFVFNYKIIKEKSEKKYYNDLKNWNEKKNRLLKEYNKNKLQVENKNIIIKQRIAEWEQYKIEFEKYQEDLDKYNSVINDINYKNQQKEIAYNSDLKKYEKKYENYINLIEKLNKYIDEYNNELNDKYNVEFDNYIKENENLKSIYNTKNNEYKESLLEYNKNYDELKSSIAKYKEKYLIHENDAVILFIDYLFKNYVKIIPDFPDNYELEYSKNNNLLIIEYQLPLIEDINTIKEIKYIKSKDEIKKVYFPKNQTKKIYENVLYQIPLKILKQIFDADYSNSNKVI